MSIKPSGESAEYRRGYEDGCKATRGHHDEAAKLRALAKQASPSFRALTEELSHPADAVREALDPNEAALVLRTLANNAGTPRIAKALNECAEVVAALTARVAEQTAQLARCFKIAGADCDGNEDWRIAPRAVQAVTDLRRDYDEACNEVESLRLNLDEEKRTSDALNSRLAALAGAAPDTVPVPASVFAWLMGEEGEFVCPPDRYFRGKEPAYWWRSVLREKIATTPHAPAKAREDGIKAVEALLLADDADGPEWNEAIRQAISALATFAEGADG